MMLLKYLLLPTATIGFVSPNRVASQNTELYSSAAAHNERAADPTFGSTSSSTPIYSKPALYDLAFGYRSFKDETDFLLYAHEGIVGRPATRVLEMAAGPARHLMEAAKGPQVSKAMALDLSPEMVTYGKELAENELTQEQQAWFEYKQGDMRSFESKDKFDTAWILLGSLQHMTTNEHVLSCFKTIYNALDDEGSFIIELPHPRETFSMVDCTRNDWQVPLEDESGSEYGELQIVWGDETDVFDPITQIRNFTVTMNLVTTTTNDDEKKEEGESTSEMDSLSEIVPMRQFTAQEIDALATCSGFRVAAMYGALDEEVGISDEDEAFRLVCVLHKKSSS